MLSLLATVVAEVLGVTTRIALITVGENTPLLALSGTLLLVAALTGLILLILTPFVVRLRDVPPPQPLVVAAYAAGVVPLVTLALLARS